MPERTIPTPQEVQEAMEQLLKEQLKRVKDPLDQLIEELTANQPHKPYEEVARHSFIELLA